MFDYVFNYHKMIEKSYFAMVQIVLAQDYGCANGKK